MSVTLGYYTSRACLSSSTPFHLDRFTRCPQQMLYMVFTSMLFFTASTTCMYSTMNLQLVTQCEELCWHNCEMCDRAEKRSLSFCWTCACSGMRCNYLSVTWFPGFSFQHGILERDATNERYLEERGRDYQWHGKSGEGEGLLIAGYPMHISDMALSN